MTVSLLGTFATTVIAAGGGGAAVAYAIFKGFGAKWLDQRFGTAMERQRHENATELERLKLGISQQLDRSVKLAHREFDTLPELWDLVVEAEALARLTYMRFSTHSDLSVMSDDDCEAYLERVEIPAHHRREILTVAARERNALFHKSEQLKYESRAWAAYSKAATTLERASIFLPVELHSAFTELVELIRLAIIDAEMRREDGVKLSELVHAQELRKNGKAKLSRVRQLVSERLTA